MKNHGTPRQSFTFTEVTPPTPPTPVATPAGADQPGQPGRQAQQVPPLRMDFRIGLPLASLTITHLAEPVAAGLAVTHGVRIAGPLAPLFAVVVGRGLVRGLPDVVRRVVDGALTEPA